MILDVDIGNSRLKWRCGTQSGVFPSALFEGLAGQLGQQKPSLIRVGCVAKAEIQSEFDEYCQRIWGLAPRFAKVQQGVCGLKLSYSKVGQFGVDRWLGLLASLEKFEGCAIAMVDAGSALTVDVLDSKRQHLGGYIVPGWGPLLEKFFVGLGGVRADGAQLSQVVAPGASTVAGVSAGCSAMYQGFFEVVFRELRDSVGEPKVILTGGAADAFIPIMKSFEVKLIPSLVLDGLKFAVPTSE